MYRRIMEELIKWKKCKERKPLILRGARQVGKTYIIKQFGEENYDGVAYFNFDRSINLSSSSLYFIPILSNNLGYILILVNPGNVFISFI